VDERSRAQKRIEALLEREGDEEALTELRRLQAFGSHAETLGEVTRALLGSEKTYRLVFSHELAPTSLSTRGRPGGGSADPGDRTCNAHSGASTV
jgi:hypothetical protein